MALPPELSMARRRSCAGFGKPVRLVAGGARRQDSVARAFEAIDPPADVIVIHDAARPFVDAATIDRTIDAAIARAPPLPRCPRAIR